MASDKVVFDHLDIEQAPEHILRKYPHLNDILNLLKAMDKESDRGKVLIACSLIDDTLGKMLSSFLVDDPRSNKLIDGFNAPLSTFSSKTTACFALGLLSSDEFKEINTMRKIRNRFAHEIHVSFDDQQIKDLVGNLEFFGEKKDGTDMSISDRFMSSTYGIMLFIGPRPAEIAKQHRRTMLVDRGLVRS